MIQHDVHQPVGWYLGFVELNATRLLVHHKHVTMYTRILSRSTTDVCRVAVAGPKDISSGGVDMEPVLPFTKFGLFCIRSIGITAMQAD